ncbi:MAG: exodeoxyribonuclease VII small subunit [Chloroflexota bacterium]
MSVEGLSFEAAFARLEETVRTLERGDLTLAEMISAYEEGVGLCAQCGRLLDAAELRVSQLVQSSAGEMDTIPFDLRNSVTSPSED